MLPQNAQTAPPPPPLEIYVVVDGQQVGPMDPSGFTDLFSSPEDAASTLVWIAGMPNWEPASSVPQLAGLIASIGQPSADGAAFAVGNIQTYLQGTWMTESFIWELDGVEHNALMTMKLLPDGRFEGSTLFWETDVPDPDIEVSFETGRWTVGQTSDGRYSLGRTISFTSMEDRQMVEQGNIEDTFVFEAQGPDDILSEEGIAMVRVPPGP